MYDVICYNYYTVCYNYYTEGVYNMKTRLCISINELVSVALRECACRNDISISHLVEASLRSTLSKPLGEVLSAWDTDFIEIYAQIVGQQAKTLPDKDIVEEFGKDIEEELDKDTKDEYKKKISEEARKSTLSGHRAHQASREDDTPVSAEETKEVSISAPSGITFHKGGTLQASPEGKRLAEAVEAAGGKDAYEKQEYERKQKEQEDSMKDATEEERKTLELALKAG